MKPHAVPIAIVGINALFPGSVNKGEFWRNILDGNDLLSDVPGSHFSIEDYYDENPGEQDKIYCTRGGFLPDVDFDPMEFAIPPGSLSATDTSQLLALRVAKQVLEEAVNGQFAEMDRDRISVILGVTSATELVVDLSARIQRPVWEKALRENGVPEDEVQTICDSIAAHYVPWQEGSFPGLLGNVVAGRIANRLNLGGSNFVTDAACASSLSAVSMAIKDLASFESDLVITGGVDTMNDIFMYMCFTKTPALSRTGDCRPFSHDADGTILGEGIGMVALKRLEDAERDKDPIYAVIRGYGASSDGSAKSVYAPNPDGQAKALRRAYAMAGYGPDTVELMEAHGTGTKAGDVAEFESLRTVFAETGRSDRQWCALGSVKSQIGHTKAAAGAAGLFKAVMALHHKILPPTIKVTKPNPRLNIDDSPFYINTEARPWFGNPKHPRRASLSSFGFGGSNFHLTLEEYTGKGKKAHRIRHSNNELIVLSADNAEALMKQCERLQDRILQDDAEQSIQFIARATQEKNNDNLLARLAITASSKEELLSKIKQAINYLQRGEAQFEAPGLYCHIHLEYSQKDRPKIAFLFPGQGSQYPGMMKQLAMEFDELRGIWEKVSANERLSGLPELAFPRPGFSDDEKAMQAERLASIEWAQPAIGAAGLVGLRFLQRLGIRPDAVGGHSFGEITALCAAGVFNDDAMLDIARMRAMCMKEAAESQEATGTMTAVFLDDRALQERIHQADLDVVIANINAPDQCVISGSVGAVEQAESLFKKDGVRFQRLSVAGAFHSPLVASAADKFRRYLEPIAFSRCEVPVYSNNRGKLFADSPEKTKDQLAQQIADSVDFVSQIQRMIEDGITIFVEVGPSSVLSGLVERNAKYLLRDDIVSLSLDKKGVPGLNQVHNLLAQLYVRRVPMKLASLWDDVEPIPDGENSPKRKMDIKIRGSNYGKPYPGSKDSANGVVPVRKIVQENTENNDAKLHYIKPHHDLSADYFVNEFDQGGTDMNKGIAEAHAMYLKMISENHTLFLQAAARMPYQSNGGAVSPLNVQQVMSPPMTALSQEFHNDLTVQDIHNGRGTESVRQTTNGQPAQPVQHAQQAQQAQDVRVNEQTQNEPVWQPSQDHQEPQEDANSNAIDQSIRDILLSIVSDKTGYPADMLDMDADLESELGIDSIKRVEIFAAIQETVAGLPALDPDQVTGLHTLSEIESFVDGLLGKKKVTS